MIKSTLFVRVVPADRDRGYILLVGYSPDLVQSSAIQYTTLTDITRATINNAISRIQAAYNGSEIKDITAPALKRKLQKLFGEPVDKA